MKMIPANQNFDILTAEIQTWQKRVKEGSERYAYRLSFLFPTTASFSLTWDQAPFSFLFVNNIPAGKQDYT